MPKHRRALAWLIVLSIGASGGLACSKAKQGLNPVTGKVLHKGQPLSGALVSFHPDGRQGDAAVGLTKADGTFELMTGDVAGAQPGSYTVTVMHQVAIEKKGQGMSFGGEPETEDSLKGAYANRDSSRLKAEVKDGPNQLEPFDLQ